MPLFAIIDTARHNDALRARELCADIRSGGIVIFDKAYLDFDHHFGLLVRWVCWVRRAKENILLRVIKKLLRKPNTRILGDDEVILVTRRARGQYPLRLRRVRALVELDGRETATEFLTNNFDWAPTGVADLCHWQIEVFFKQIKQTLPLCEVLGHRANAVRWQVWMALLLYVLLRFQFFLQDWPHSFTRLFTLLRAVLWDRFHLPDLCSFYETSRWRMRTQPEQENFPRFEPGSMGQHAF